MNRLLETLVFAIVSLGAVIGTFFGWIYGPRFRRDLKEPRWRTVGAFIGLVLVTLSVMLFATYLTRNAVIGGDANGSRSTLIFIRTGNYLSLAGVIASLTGKGKARWPAFVSGCLMLFIWLSEGMSL